MGKAYPNHKGLPTTEARHFALCRNDRLGSQQETYPACGANEMRLYRKLSVAASLGLGLRN